MDVIQSEYQSARKKIYTGPPLPIDPRSDHHEMLPPMVPTIDSKGRQTFISAAEVTTQLDRFRTLLREKEGELLKLKHETVVLKQVISISYLSFLKD